MKPFNGFLYSSSLGEFDPETIQPSIKKLSIIKIQLVEETNTTGLFVEMVCQDDLCMRNIPIQRCLEDLGYGCGPNH